MRHTKKEKPKAANTSKPSYICSMEHKRITPLLAAKGMAMGMAEVIPGVSGGTIAFITGIYEQLINSIKAFGPGLIPVWRKDGFKGVWQAIDGNFLVGLVGGMLVGLVVGVFGISLLLEHYPPLVWAFFFGLILASVLYIGRQVKWGIGTILALIIAAAVAYWITIISPAQGSDALWMVFIAGAIAISALILPGISGSFILLLMGMYTLIVPSVKNLIETQDMASLTIVGVFGLGCLVGLASFSRLLSWTFKNYRNITLAALTGFMLGSLNKIWPWRNVIETRINSSGEEVPFIEENVWPAQYDGDALLIGAIVVVLLGFASVFVLERLGGSNEAS